MNITKKFHLVVLLVHIVKVDPPQKCENTFERR